MEPDELTKLLLLRVRIAAKEGNTGGVDPDDIEALCDFAEKGNERSEDNSAHFYGLNERIIEIVIRIFEVLPDRDKSIDSFFSLVMRVFKFVSTDPKNLV